jgi:hypothetical protein
MAYFYFNQIRAFEMKITRHPTWSGRLNGVGQQIQSVYNKIALSKAVPIVTCIHLYISVDVRIPAFLIGYRSLLAMKREVLL